MSTMSQSFLMFVALSSILCCVVSLNLTNQIDMAKDSNQKIRMIYKILGVMNTSLSSHEQKMNMINESIDALREDMYDRIGEINELIVAVNRSLTSRDQIIDDMSIKMNKKIDALKEKTDKLKLEHGHIPMLHGTCPDGSWKTFRNQCFQLLKERKTWIQSRDHCQSLGAHLVDIPDAQTDAFILSMIKDTTNWAVWIGLNDIAKEGVYVWDGSSRALSSSSYTNWFREQPGTYYDEWDYGQLSVFDAKWYMAGQKETRWFVCQKALEL